MRGTAPVTDPAYSVWCVTVMYHKVTQAHRLYGDRAALFRSFVNRLRA
jgi:hypothetical protein